MVGRVRSRGPLTEKGGDGRAAKTLPKDEFTFTSWLSTAKIIAPEDELPDGGVRSRVAAETRTSGTEATQAKGAGARFADAAWA